MKEYTLDEMRKAVTVIQEVCSQHDCDNCPFGKEIDTIDCVIQEIVPEDWDIRKPENLIFR